jgi:Tol biopolymer transport system component
VEEGIMSLQKSIWCVGLLVFLAGLPAYATFPGKNGRIAFVQGPDIFVMNPDGSDVRQLTSFTDESSAFWQNWSPDGRQLVFTRFSAPDFFGQLWLMNADGSNQHLLLNDPGFDDEAPSFSPDGSHVVFSRCAPLGGEFPCAVYRVGVDGSGLVPLTPVRIEVQDLEPVYSPDGTSIAFDSFGRDGVIAEIQVMNADGTQLHELSDAELEGYAADWSPNGHQFVFTTSCCNAELSNLVVTNQNGEGVRRLTDDKGTFTAGRSSWSPQGDAIVFRSTNVDTGDFGIYVISADGNGQAKQILKVRPTTPMKHGPRVTTGSRWVKNKKKVPGSTQIEDGGAFPRWGSAQ